jgi:GC-rich sequence DNA-binding factor
MPLLSLVGSAGSIEIGFTDVDLDESATVIPSEASIKAAKERRDNRRKVGTTEDFISLTVTRKQDEYQGPHPESRLVREEDELGEGDDGECFGFPLGRFYGY